MRPVSSWWVCVFLCVLRSGRKFLTPLWRVSVISFASTYCFLSFVLFVIQHNFLLTLLILFFFVHILHADLLFTGLDDILSWLEQVEQRPSRTLPRLGDTTDTSGDESDVGEPRRRLRSKKSYKMKRAWGTSDVGQFFVTGPTDVATKPSHFFAEFVVRTCQC